MAIGIILCCSDVIRIVSCGNVIRVSNGTIYLRSAVFRIVSTGAILCNFFITLMFVKIVLSGAFLYCGDAVINMLSRAILCSNDSIYNTYTR